MNEGKLIRTLKIKKQSRCLVIKEPHYCPICCFNSQFFIIFWDLYLSSCFISSSVCFLYLPHPLPSGPVGTYYFPCYSISFFISKNSLGGLYFFTWSTLISLPQISAPLKLSTAKIVDLWSSYAKNANPLDLPVYLSRPKRISTTSPNYENTMTMSPSFMLQSRFPMKIYALSYSLCHDADPLTLFFSSFKLNLSIFLVVCILMFQKDKSQPISNLQQIPLYLYRKNQGKRQQIKKQKKDKLKFANSRIILIPLNQRIPNVVSILNLFLRYQLLGTGPFSCQSSLQGLLQLLKVLRRLKNPEQFSILVQETDGEIRWNRLGLVGLVINEHVLSPQVLIHWMGARSIDLYVLEQRELNVKLITKFTHQFIIGFRLCTSKLIAGKRHDFQPMIPVLGVQFIEHLEITFGETVLTSDIHQKERTPVLVNVEVDPPASDVVGLEVEEGSLVVLAEILLFGAETNYAHVQILLFIIVFLSLETLVLNQANYFLVLILNLLR